MIVLWRLPIQELNKVLRKDNLAAHTLRTGCRLFKASKHKRQDDLFQRLTFFCLALPENQHIPAQPLPSFLVFPIACNVPFDLRAPVSAVGFRVPRPVLARVPVPETSAHIDNFAQPWKHQIWMPRQIRDVEPVTITESENELAHDHLGLCVLCPDCRHVAAPLISSQPICHSYSCGLSVGNIILIQ
jgi:hypothetical protein